MAVDTDAVLGFDRVGTYFDALWWVVTKKESFVKRVAVAVVLRRASVERILAASAGC